MTDSTAAGDRLELVVFDFDGTLCDSADVKTDAFYRLYLDDHGPGFADAVRDYHLANAGLSRYDKIRHVERELLGNEPDERRDERVASCFSRLVEEAVVDAPLFGGVPDLLAAPPSGTRYALASATPTDELRRITDRKGISGFFAAIEGSPRSKAVILSEYVSNLATGPRNVLMVGDQPSDADAARSVGTEALLIAPPAAWIAPFSRVDDFTEAAQWLHVRMSGDS
jgi:phosphoglycolate phosphatase-like HAD superfamily hydrolase